MVAGPSQRLRWLKFACPGCTTDFLAAQPILSCPSRQTGSWAERRLDGTLDPDNSARQVPVSYVLASAFCRVDPSNRARFMVFTRQGTTLNSLNGTFERRLHEDQVFVPAGDVLFRSPGQRDDAVQGRGLLWGRLQLW